MSSAETVARLKERLRRWEGEFRGRGDEPASGVERAGALLRGELRRGTLVEWLREADGGPAEAVSLGLASRLIADGGTLVVVDRERAFFPPAAVSLGIEPSSIVVVRPRDEREALWAFDQALRSRAVSIVWGRMERLPGRAYRRLQLSAEEGGTIGFLSRSARTRSQAAWCEMSVVVRPHAGHVVRPHADHEGRSATSPPLGHSDTFLRFETEIVRSRDGTTGRKERFAWTADATNPFRLTDSDDMHPVRLVPAMGGAATAGPVVDRRTGSAS